MITDTPNSDGNIFDIGLFLEAVRDPNGSGIAPPESSSGHGRGVCSDGLIHVGGRSSESPDNTSCSSDREPTL